MTQKFHLEYIWLDGSFPQGLRSKTKIIQAEPNTKRDYQFIEFKNNPKLLPDWNFDGSSTGQAETSKSELILKPVNVFIDPFKENGFLVLCEVFNLDGTPHQTNSRNKMTQLVQKFSNEETMWGWEQEYFIYDSLTKKPLGWPIDGFPKPQGPYYCSVGGDKVSGREFVEEHAFHCEKIGLQISGINAEVALGQWEYQIGPVDAIDGSDQLWISRYILNRLTEKYGYYVELDPKPYLGNDWNGSGMHVNFSTKQMREDLKRKKALVIEACQKLSKKVEEHIQVYGPNNHNRLTGHNETCSINEFRFGIGDRTASIRIPSSIEDKNTPGYLEDRRPASNANPYEIVYRMIKTVCKSDKSEDKLSKKKIKEEVSL